MKVKTNSITNSIVQAILGLMLLWPVQSFAILPKVVASIHPFCTLAMALMEDVGTPICLLPVGASPHDFTLKPSDQKILKEATVIFWGGSDLESFLTKPLASLSKASVALANTPGLRLYPVRHSMDWSVDHSHTGDVHTHQHGYLDMHVWLDPKNALLMMEVMLAHLLKLDPSHDKIYQKNAVRFSNRLRMLDQQLNKQLSPIKKIPYVVFHDAYQYFDKHYGLNAVGSIYLHPELPLSAKRFSQIQTIIQRKKVVCIFSEPQFNAGIAQQLAKELKIKTAVLDPIGEDYSVDGYFTLLQNIAKVLSDCLIH